MNRQMTASSWTPKPGNGLPSREPCSCCGKTGDKWMKRGWCAACYQRWDNNGRPESGPPRIYRPRGESGGICPVCGEDGGWITTNGWCMGCQGRWRRAGSPQSGPPPRRLPGRPLHLRLSALGTCRRQGPPKKDLALRAARPRQRGRIPAFATPATRAWPAHSGTSGAGRPGASLRGYVLSAAGSDDCAHKKTGALPAISAGGRPGGPETSPRPCGPRRNPTSKARPPGSS